MHAQLSLLGHEPPAFDGGFCGIRRRELGDGAWVDLCEGWLAGDAQVFRALETTTRWQHDRREMYERVVDVPRLLARFPEHGPGHPVLWLMSRALSARYGQRLDQVSAAWYRDGRDSVALHGDRIARVVDHCVVAIVSLGAPRRFLLKPAAGGESLLYRLGYGDLLVMGGSCQRTWRHGVPKAANAAPRISVQYRPSPPALVAA
jgi:alkylated DNA repair dioxygenase AlkB